MMAAYTSRCSGKTVEHLRRAGWRFIVEPSQTYRSPPPLPYGLDNGAWACHKRGQPFNVAAFERDIEYYGQDADWIVIPDIVGGGLNSLDMSRSWIPRLTEVGRPLLLPVQDGMEPRHVEAVLSPKIGIFLGGSTDWKLSTMPQWGDVARAVGAWFHVGRVNSSRRIRLCQIAGADSFDGSSPTRFRKTLRKLDMARRQEGLFGGARDIEGFVGE